MKDYILQQFNTEYKDIKTTINNNTELTEEQQRNLLIDFEDIVNTIREGSIYRSTYHLLKLIMRDIQFYEFINRKEEE